MTATAMTSRQRVLTAMRGEIPDRVPLGEFAIDFDTVEKVLGHETYLRAKAKSQIAFWQGRHDEVAQSYLEDHIELHKKLPLDIITFPMATWEIPLPSDDPPPRKVDDNTWEDAYGRIFRYSEYTADITCIHDPVLEARQFTREEFEREPVIPELHASSWRIVNTVIETFKGQKFICGPSGGEIGIIMLGGVERGCIELALNPDVVAAATRYYLTQQNKADELYVHPDSDAVLWGHDFGHKTGPFISPAMFRESFVPANKARVRHLKEKYGLKVMKHCCGKVWSLLDDFLEIGYDAYQSIQPTADMDICLLKEKYGDRLTLWGGVAVENLVSGTAQMVREDVRRAMSCAKPGGRFILGASHSIAVGTKYDNYMAMLDEYHKLCAY